MFSIWVLLRVPLNRDSRWNLFWLNDSLFMFLNLYLDWVRIELLNGNTTIVLRSLFLFYLPLLNLFHYASSLANSCSLQPFQFSWFVGVRYEVSHLGKYISKMPFMLFNSLLKNMIFHREFPILLLRIQSKPLLTQCYSVFFLFFHLRCS